MIRRTETIDPASEAAIAATLPMLSDVSVRLIWRRVRHYAMFAWMGHGEESTWQISGVYHGETFAVRAETLAEASAEMERMFKPIGEVKAH